MSACQILGHHMEPALGEWDKDYADRYCTRCGHCEPGVTLLRQEEPPQQVDPLVRRGEHVDFAAGWSGAALLLFVIPILLGFFVSWVGAGIWWAICVVLIGMLGGDGGAGGAAGGGGDGGIGAVSIAQGPLR